MVKKYTKKNVSGNAGEAYVDYYFTHTYQWIYRKMPVDIGLDGEVEIIKNGTTTSLIFKTQVKSSLDPNVKKTANGYSIQIDKDDIMYWKNLRFPIVLLFNDLKDKKVYFKLVNNKLKIEPTSSDTQQLYFDTELTDKSDTDLENFVNVFHTQIDPTYSYFTAFIETIEEANNLLERINSYKGGDSSNQSLLSKSNFLIQALEAFVERKAFFGSTGNRIMIKTDELRGKWNRLKQDVDRANSEGHY